MRRLVQLGAFQSIKYTYCTQGRFIYALAKALAFLRADFCSAMAWLLACRSMI